MLTIKNISIIFLLFIAIVSCKKSNDALNNTINKPLILGKWYPSPGQFDYKSRYYGADSSYITDATNLSFGIIHDKWYWGIGDTIKYTWGGGTTLNSQKILKLTQDSLIILYIGYSTKPFRYHR